MYINTQQYMSIPKVGHEEPIYRTEWCSSCIDSWWRQRIHLLIRHTTCYQFTTVCKWNKQQDHLITLRMMVIFVCQLLMYCPSAYVL